MHLISTARIISISYVFQFYRFFPLWQFFLFFFRGMLRQFPAFRYANLRSAQCIHKFRDCQNTIRDCKTCLFQIIRQQRNLRNIQTVLFQLIYSGKNLFRNTVHHNVSAIHHIHIVSKYNFFHIMSNQNNRYPFFFVQFPYCFQYFFSSVGIQHGGWLIQNDTFRMHRHNACNSYTLFLSAGQFVW